MREGRSAKNAAQKAQSTLFQLYRSGIPLIAEGEKAHVAEFFGCTRETLIKSKF